MTEWDALRRAKDNLRPHRSMKLLPSILKDIIDEIRTLKREVEKLKEKR